MNLKLFDMSSHSTLIRLSRYVRIAWIGFFSIIGITFLLWSNARENEMDDAKNRFETSTLEVVDDINVRMHTYENALQSSVALLNTVERMNHQKWNTYISSLKLSEHYPGFQGIGFSKVILPDKLSEHIVHMRAEEFPDYTVHPLEKRKEYHAIIYLAPMDKRNRRVIGYDMFSSPVRKQAMMRARDTAQPALSGKVRLLQEQVGADVQAGLLMYVPFYHTQGELLTQAQMKEKFEGFVYAPFRAKDLMHEILKNKSPHIAVKVYDTKSVKDTNLLYDSEIPGSTMDEKPLFKTAVFLDMYGRTWTVLFQTLPSFEKTIDYHHSLMIALVGLSISLFVLIVLFSFSQTTQQAQIMARQMTAEISELNNELENMINTAPNPIIVHTEDGAIVKINQTWSDLCGYTYEETPTTDIWVDKVYREHQEEVKAYIRNLFTTITQKVDEGEFSFYSKSGSKITWQFSSAPFGTINGKKAIISSAMDITELKNKDDYIMLQSRHAAMGEMINMIAHQWRQPLASITAVSGLLSLEVAIDEYDKNHFTEKLDLISDMALDLSDTINDFKNFFKEDKTKELTTWKELIDESLVIISPLLISKSITLHSTFYEDYPFMTYTREIKQVIFNLLKNAEDVLSDNLIHEPTIWIRTRCEGNMSCLEIEDNGGGISEEIIDRIFDPYFSTKMEKNGTGIGLYMSKTIVEKHGQGSLNVYNTAFGACFKIIFPIYG